VRCRLNFYSRDPLQLGGIRFSPSTQRFETSIGFEGLSFDLGVKGNFIHLGKDDKYYCTATKLQNRKKSRLFTRPDEDEVPPHKQSNQRNLFLDRNSKYDVDFSVSSSRELVKQLRDKQKRFPVWPIAILLTLIPKYGFLICMLLIPILYYFVDKPRNSTLLYYDITPDVEEEVQLFFRSFNELITCHSAWYVVSQQRVDVVKYNAGASWLVKRKRLKIQYRVPPLLKTNILVPCLFLGNQRLFFLPDHILFQQYSDIKALPYSKLTIRQKNIKFIEEQKIAPDSKQIGRTWRFVNIDGGPDRRFKSNRELPMLLYSELTMTSSNGFKVMLLLSKPDVGSQLERAIHSYASSDFLSE